MSVVSNRKKVDKWVRGHNRALVSAGFFFFSFFWFYFSSLFFFFHLLFCFLFLSSWELKHVFCSHCMCFMRSYYTCEGLSTEKPFVFHFCVFLNSHSLCVFTNSWQSCTFSHSGLQPHCFTSKNWRWGKLMDVSSAFLSSSMCFLQ